MSDHVRHRLRDAVFGVQDGLVSTLGALVGIAAGTHDQRTVVIAGCVIVVVESLSMAAGSYLSSKSQREYLERLLQEEREAIANDPEGERRELWAMYRERGFADEEIAMIERRLFNNPHWLLEDMAHKEHGICPQALEDAAGNALVMGLAYVVGGLIPVLPYVWLPLNAALTVSIVGALVALFLFGSIKGRLVKGVWWASGLEMLGVAGAAGLIGFVVGRLAGLVVR